MRCSSQLPVDDLHERTMARDLALAAMAGRRVLSLFEISQVAARRQHKVAPVPARERVAKAAAPCAAGHGVPFLTARVLEEVALYCLLRHRDDGCC